VTKSSDAIEGLHPTGVWRSLLLLTQSGAEPFFRSYDVVIPESPTTDASAQSALTRLRTLCPTTSLADFDAALLADPLEAVAIGRRADWCFKSAATPGMADLAELVSSSIRGSRLEEEQLHDLLTCACRHDQFAAVPPAARWLLAVTRSVCRDETLSDVAVALRERPLNAWASFCAAQFDAESVMSLYDRLALYIPFVELRLIRRIAGFYFDATDWLEVNEFLVSALDVCADPEWPERFSALRPRGPYADLLLPLRT
jgi:hypothetical protein